MKYLFPANNLLTAATGYVPLAESINVRTSATKTGGGMVSLIGGATEDATYDIEIVNNTIVGNYIDNSSIGWTNEDSRFSFHSCRNSSRKLKQATTPRIGWIKRAFCPPPNSPVRNTMPRLRAGVSRSGPELSRTASRLQPGRRVT